MVMHLHGLRTCLYLMYALLYSCPSNPMDIVLACGVNNMPTNDTAKVVIDTLQSFVRTIKDHSLRNGHK